MEESQEKEHQELVLELESAAGDTTPLSMPSLADEESNSSPEDAVSSADKPPMEVFDLQESSSDGGSPEMEQDKLFIKLKVVRAPPPPNCCGGEWMQGWETVSANLLKF